MEAIFKILLSLCGIILFFIICGLLVEVCLQVWPEKINVFISSSPDRTGTRIIYAVAKNGKLGLPKYIYCGNKKEENDIKKAYSMVYYEDFLKEKENE